MPEALAQVKRDLGRSAMILRTRSFRRGGLLGLGGRRIVEITAAESSSGPSAHPCATVERSAPAISHRGPAAVRLAVPPEPAAEAASSAPDLAGQMGQIHSLVQQLVRETRQSRHPDVPAELFGTYQQLIGQAVADELAATLIQSLQTELSPDRRQDSAAVREHLQSLIASSLPPQDAIQLTDADRPTVVALVGPTGVGKTTTIAKLAADFKLRRHRRVGLVTIDTYRIAAVDQLRTYAQILDVPLEVALSPADLVAAVRRLHDRELILIDTAGRSPSDTIKINQLRGFFDALRPDEVHLVLSGTSSEAAMLAAAQRFATLGFDKVLLTKLDETVGIGVMLSVLRQIDRRLSYVTTGQDVPADLCEAAAAPLAAWILGETPVRPDQPALQPAAVCGAS